MRRQLAAKRETWMADFERRIVAARPDLAGRIDWNTALHLFNTGWTPDTAAARVLKRLAEEVGK